MSSSMSSGRGSAPCSAALAGMVGGSVATLVLHPLELLKTRQAVYGQDNNKAVQQTYSRLTRAVVDIVKHEGGVRGLYKGVGANVMVASSSWGIYFLAYGALKREGGFGQQLGAAFGAGAVTVLLSNPLSVVRTRMLLNNNNNNNNNNKMSKTSKMSVWSVLKNVVRHEGFGGLYKGLTPNLLNVSHGALQIVVYEHIRSRLVLHKNQKLALEETLMATCISKLVASLATYPCQAVRACQQASMNKCSVHDIVRKGGVAALYRGLGAYLMHVVPNVCLVFAAYEAIANH